MGNAIAAESIVIRVSEGIIEADLRVPDRAVGLVVFAHGSGSSRFSSRNRAVAEYLETNGFATFLLDLLTREEEAVDIYTREFRFDIDLLGRRVVVATDWAQGREDLKTLPIGYGRRSSGYPAGGDAGWLDRSGCRRPDQRTSRKEVHSGTLPDPVGAD